MGWPERSSHAMNAPSSTTATANQPRVIGCAQPLVGAWMMA